MKREGEGGIVVPLLATLLLASARSEDATPERTERITSAALEHRLRLGFDDGVFAGPAWDRLVAEGKASQFLMVGEEHGIAENPLLVAQLFEALAPHGYSKLAIEISPVMASLLDEAAVGGDDRADVEHDAVLDGLDDRVRDVRGLRHGARCLL